MCLDGLSNCGVIVAIRSFAYDLDFAFFYTGLNAELLQKNKGNKHTSYISGIILVKKPFLSWRIPMLFSNLINFFFYRSLV